MLLKKEIIDDNKKLREENRKQKEEIERLINTIDKAIEYVEENLIPENVRQLNGEEFVLLEILKGDNNKE